MINLAMLGRDLYKDMFPHIVHIGLRRGNVIITLLLRGSGSRQAANMNIMSR